MLFESMDIFELHDPGYFFIIMVHVFKAFSRWQNPIEVELDLTLLLVAVLEITVGHRTLSKQILKMSGQFHIMIGHDDRTCHQHILSSLLQGVVSQ